MPSVYAWIRGGRAEDHHRSCGVFKNCKRGEVAAREGNVAEALALDAHVSDRPRAPAVRSDGDDSHGVVEERTLQNLAFTEFNAQRDNPPIILRFIMITRSRSCPQ